MEITKDAGLKTWDLGSLEGTKQTKEAQGAVDKQMINQPDKPVGGGESFTQFSDRVFKSIQKIVSDSPANTAVVTHNSVFGLIKTWDDAGRPKHFYKALREKYSKQDSSTGDFYTIKGKNGAIYVCRHGETDDNKEGNFRSEDTQLTDKGREQAEELGDKLSNVKLGEVISSPIERAVETAELIIKEQEGEESDDKDDDKDTKEEEEESKGLDKSVFLYMEPRGDKNIFAQCASCKMFLAKHNICSLHGKDVKILPTMSCGLYSFGKAEESEMEHVSVATTPEESGLIDGKVRCENCEYFEKSDNDCLLFRLLNIEDYKVDPKACCNAFSGDD